jgi:hypothetical protein
MKLSGAIPGARLEPLEKLPGISNYYLGNDPAKWRSNVPQYASNAMTSIRESTWFFTAAKGISNMTAS